MAHIEKMVADVDLDSNGEISCLALLDGIRRLGYTWIREG